MNILIFNWRDLKHGWAGGGEVYIFEVAKRWVKSGNKVTIFCGADNERKLPEKEVYDGISIIRRGNRYSVYFWAAVYYLRKQLGSPDVVIDVINGIPFFTPLFCRKPKVAFIFHVHNKQFFYELSFPFNFIGYFVERFINPIIYSSIKIIAISATTKHELIKLGYKPRKISTVYCGVSNKATSKQSHKKYSSPTLLYLGRIKAYKRVNKLVEVFGNVLSDNPNVTLIIAGWGTEASSVVETIMKSKYRRRIKLLGPVTEAEKKDLLSKSWVFVNLSIGEGWGISVIEANRFGTPAVAFNVPGLSESITHNKTGFLAKNDKDLLKYINQLIINKNLRNKLSKNAQEWSKKFTWDNTAKDSLQIIVKETKINR